MKKIIMIIAAVLAAAVGLTACSSQGRGFRILLYIQ